MKTHPVSKSPDNGLTLKADGYYARYYQDGKQLFLKLHTDDTDTARSARDRFYAKLTPRVHEKNGRKRSVPPGIDALPDGVAYRKPWHLKIDGRGLGRFHTLKEVMDAHARAVNVKRTCADS